MPILDHLPPGLAPGGLVFVGHDNDDNEVVRSVLTPDRLASTDALATDAGQEVFRRGGGTLVAYDGDTGELVWYGHFE